MSLEVLIVDDDDIILVLHKVRIKKIGLSSNPICLIDGLEALNYIRNNDASEKEFLILLDINMPRMNGWQLVEALENNPVAAKISVAIVTSSVDLHDKELAQQHKMVFDFFEKPLEDYVLEELKKKFLSQSND